MARLPMKPDFKELMVKLEGKRLGDLNVEKMIIKEMARAVAKETEEMGLGMGDFEIGQPEADFETGSITVRVAIRTPVHLVQGFKITLEDMSPRERAVHLHGTLEELRRKLGEKT